MLAKLMRAALAVLLAGWLAGPALAATDGWMVYEDAEHGVRIDMPGAPQISREPGESNGVAYVTTMAIVANDTSFYGLAMTDFQVDSVGDPWVALSAAAAGSAAEAKATIVSETRTEVEGAPAIDAVMYRADGDLHIRTVLVARGTRLYQAIALGARDYPPQTARFLGSLHFTTPAGG